MMRQKSRKDLNQTAVVAKLRERGWGVDIVERPYDIVVSGWRDAMVVNGVGFYGFECSLRVELKSEKGKLSDSQKKYIENLRYPDSFMVATSSAEDPMPAVIKIEKWFGR